MLGEITTLPSRTAGESKAHSQKSQSERPCRRWGAEGPLNSILYIFALDGSATSETSGATLRKIRCTFRQTFALNILKIFARSSIILKILFAFSAAALLIDSQTNSKMLNAWIG